MSESTADQDRIEEELARTRSRMDGRLTALQERLSPGQILDDLMAYFRGSEGGDFARNLLNSVQNNPMPAALTGIGLAWLMASNPHPKPAASVGPAGTAGYGTPGSASLPNAWAGNNEFDRHIRSVEGSVVRQSDEAEPAFHGRLDEARGKALGLARDAQDTAETFSTRVQDALTAARQSATDAAQKISDKASATGRQLAEAIGNSGDQLARGGQATQQMAGNLLSSITDNPILLGAIGLTVGAMLGAIVPQSEQEQAALGDVGRRAREGAGDLAQEVVDRGAAITQQVLDAGRESAAGEGLTGKTAGHFVDEALKGNLAGSVGDIAKDVLKAGETAIRTEGLRQGQQDAGSSPTQPNTSFPEHTP